MKVTTIEEANDYETQQSLSMFPCSKIKMFQGIVLLVKPPKTFWRILLRFVEKSQVQNLLDDDVTHQN